MTSRSTITAFIILLFAAAGLSCSGSSGTPESETTDPKCSVSRPDSGEAFYPNLSDYCFFRGKPAKQHKYTSEAVVPYGVRSKLYSDRSDKFRFMVLPEGETIEFDRREPWSFPDRTIIIKTFYYPHDARHPSEGRRLLETRLLFKTDGDWKPQVYKWNQQQTKATRHPIGEDMTVEWTDKQGTEVTTNYRVPNTTKCRSCHSKNQELELLGPRTRQLNRTFKYQSGRQNQLEYLEKKGLFGRDIPEPTSLPKLPDPKNEKLSIDKRAKAYLEGNCAHCHNPKGPASNSGLYLNFRQDNPKKRGVCKTPVAAGEATGGFQYDIKPGYPDESIMVYRVNSNEPGIQMPELPLRTVDQSGLDILKEWIRQMRPKGCQ